MALLNDLKRLFFGAKAVTKSAAGRAVDAGKMAGKDLTDAGGDLWDRAKDTLEDAGKVVMDKAEMAMDKAGDLADDLGDKMSYAADAAKAKVSDLVDDFQDKTDGVKAAAGSAVQQKGQEIKAKAGDVMDDILAEKSTAQPAVAPVELPKLDATGAVPLLEAPDEEPGLLESLKSTTLAAGSVVAAKAGDAWQAGSEVAGQVGDRVEKIGGAVLDRSEAALDKAAEFTEGVGKKVLETGSEWAEKFGDTASDVGDALFEKGGDALEKAKGFASGLGSKILKAKDDLVARAQDAADAGGDTADSLRDKLSDLNQKLEDKISGNNTKFADTPLNTGGSEFAKHDSFWEKAERFAKGDHQMTGEQEEKLELGQLKVGQDPNYKAPEKGEDNKKKSEDDLIDDAIVEK